MANKEEVQKRLAKVIRSMESHLKTLKTYEHNLSHVTEKFAEAYTKHVDADIKDFEKFFETSDNSELKG